MQQNDLISYALEFASFLVKKVERVKKIVLFGSVAKGDFHENSDIDLFIEADKKVSKKINKIVDDFYKTEVSNKVRLKGIENEFSILIGDLNDEEWKDLNRAILVEGILLYGKYKSNVEKNYSYLLFVFENIKPDKKRVAVFRKLFGFKSGGRRYSGLVQECKGVKLGKGAVLIPLENSDKIKNYFRSKKINFKIYDLWSDVEF